MSESTTRNRNWKMALQGLLVAFQFCISLAHSTFIVKLATSAVSFQPREMEIAASEKFGAFRK